MFLGAHRSLVRDKQVLQELRNQPHVCAKSGGSQSTLVLAFRRRRRLIRQQQQQQQQQCLLRYPSKSDPLRVTRALSKAEQQGKLVTFAFRELVGFPPSQHLSFVPSSALFPPNLSTFFYPLNSNFCG